MARLILSLRAESDLRGVLRQTHEHWGPRQRERYRALIEAAFEDLVRNSSSPRSRARDDIRPGIRTLHLARRGQPARHLVVYRVAPDGTVQIVRVLHDTMDLRRHTPPIGA